MPIQSLSTERAAWWRQHVDAWRKSDLTQTAYCDAHGLSRKSFAKWRGWFKEETEIAERKALRRHIGRPRPSVKPSANPSPPPPMQALFGLPQVNRRRQFPAALKRQIVEETLQPGASVSAVARLYGVTPPCVFRWRKELGFGAVTTRKTAFASVEIAGESVAPDVSAVNDLVISPPPLEPVAGAIEIELKGGKKVRFDRDTSPETVRRMIETLEGSL